MGSSQQIYCELLEDNHFVSLMAPKKSLVHEFYHHIYQTNILLSTKTRKIGNT